MKPRNFGIDVVDVELLDDAGKILSSNKLEHHVRHSPTGHAWGYGGSGPAELAKDILWDYFGREPSGRFYQAFKFKVIAPLDQYSGFVITERIIALFMKTEDGYPMFAEVETA